MQIWPYPYIAILPYIDLLCRGRRRELIPFNRLSLSEPRRFTERDYAIVSTLEPWVTLPVEVLRRQYPGGAWRWWPGELVKLTGTGPSFPCEYYTVAVVKGQEDSGAIWADIVPKHRLRYPVLEDSCPDVPRVSAMTRLLPIGPYRFVKRSMPLPGACRAASAGQVTEVIRAVQTKHQRTRKGQVACVDVADDQAHFIVELDGDAEFPQRQADDIAQKIVASLHKALIGRLPSILRAVKAPVEHLRISGTSDDSRALGVDEWQEVFAHLDTLTQTRLRAVCPAWDAILDTPLLTANIIIQTVGGERLPGLQYTLTAPIFKCLHSFTKRVIIHDRQHIIRMAEFLTMLDMLHFVARTRPEIRLRALYTVGVTKLTSEPDLDRDIMEPEACDVHNPDNGYFEGHLEGLIATCRGLPCSAMHLVGCRVRLRYDLSGLLQKWDAFLLLDVDMARTRLLLNGDVASTVWNAVEAALPAPSGDEIRTLSDWLATIAREENQELNRTAVCKVLCTTHTADPRPSLQYRGKKWCADGLQDLRLEKLSRTTLRFLLLLHSCLAKSDEWAD
ncbi:uncharacterized protein LOC129582783 [Paramacrobiotus metropolitanus]|uniref:uncharacterized protein LOC129582783 n=1 Tax=Paramacrobiotus metropolitanus TaxID=2943436 RepID=UPI002445724A|nr:uncharacterized protein LOC129582783 [Paramacrobiotus metropolitanus]